MNKFNVLPILRMALSAGAKQSIVRAFLSTWMCIFDKACVIEMSSV